MEQEKKTPLSELMKTTMEHVKAMADANAIIGTPIQAEGVTLIPVSRMSFGVAGDWCSRPNGIGKRYPGG